MAAKKGGRGRLIGLTKGGMNTKLHAICDSQRRPLDLFITAGEVSDYIVAWALLSRLPNVKWLLKNRGYDTGWFQEALQDKGICACILGRNQRKPPVKYGKHRYKRRNRIEIMFGRLRDGRRVANRDDHCPKVLPIGYRFPGVRHLLEINSNFKVDTASNVNHVSALKIAFACRDFLTGQAYYSRSDRITYMVDSVYLYSVSPMDL